MNTQLFSDAMGELNEKYVMEAVSYQRKTKSMSHVWLSRVACFFLVFLLTGSAILTFSVEARAAFFGWVREQVDSFYHYFFEGENVTDEPEGYELSWIPEDCVFVTSYEIPGGKSYIYTDEKDSLICFSYQSGTESGHLFVDSVKAERIEVEVNGCPAEIARYKDDAETDHIIWTDSTNKILFYITGHFDQETFIKMAESVTETSNLEE